MMDDMPKRWVGGICIRDGKVLLIYRINKERDFNQEYFLFPGGSVDEDESIEESLEKHFKNIAVTVKLGELVHTTEENDNGESEYYYLCEHLIGEPVWKDKEGEEVDEKEKKQFYTPMWIPLNELEELVVYPESLKEKVLLDISEG